MVAEAVARYVQSGMVVGLGTGSTSRLALECLGRRVREEGLSIFGIATSAQATEIAHREGIPLVDFGSRATTDIMIDSAVEVDPGLDLLKGSWGALLREKIVAASASSFIVIVDESKLVPKLGTRARLPVEVYPFGWRRAEKELKESLGAEPSLRYVDDDVPFLTESGNYIFDCRFPAGIDDARELERTINNLPGVVENGLFLGMTGFVLVGREGGVEELRRPG